MLWPWGPTACSLLFDNLNKPSKVSFLTRSWLCARAEESEGATVLVCRITQLFSALSARRKDSRDILGFWDTLWDINPLILKALSRNPGIPTLFRTRQDSVFVNRPSKAKS